MTNEQNTPPKKDWNDLAREALDLWQNHLNALADDPKMKEEMTRFVTPMTQMFSQWTSMMQTSMQGMPGFAAPSSSSTSSPSDAPEAQTQSGNVQTSEDGAAADVRPEASDSVGCDAQGDAGPSDTAKLGGDLDVILAVNDPLDERPQPVLQPSAAGDEQAARGRAAPADGHRDLAQLASRLAELERELDGLRPKTKRSADATAPAADGAVQRVAGAD